jgi:long-chain fatty acid transport protein
MRKTTTFIILAGCVLGMCRGAAASSLDLFSFGSRAPAMGGTGTAHSAGFEAVYLNPAGLTERGNKRLTVGYLYAHFDLNLSADMNAIRSPRADDAYGVLIGATIPIGFGGVMKRVMWAGMGFYLPTGVVTRSRIPEPGKPFFHLLESRAQVVGVQVCGALDLRRLLRNLGKYRAADFMPQVGAGVLALAALRGVITMEARPGGEIGSEVEQQLIVDYAPVVGVRYRWPRRWLDLRFGLVYRGESRASFDIVLDNTLTRDDLPLYVPVMLFEGMAQYDPQQVAFEVAWRPVPGLLLALQIQWKDWSRMPKPTKKVTDNDFAVSPPNPKHRDTAVPRFGVEYAHRVGSWRLAYRAGYFFEPTPAPEQNGTSNWFDNHRHIVTAGFGFSYFRGKLAPLTVDLYFQYHQLMPRKHTRPGGIVADPLTARYLLPMTRTYGGIIAAGINVGVEF